MNSPENRNELELEATLRRAPVPPAPPSLEAALRREIRLSPLAPSRNGTPVRLPATEPRGWRRWWPILLPGAVAAAFATTVVTQQLELGELRREVRQLEAASVVTPGEPGTASSATAAAAVPDAREEIARLRALVERLLAELRGADALQADNERLQAAIAAASKTLPPEMQELAEAKDRAARIACVNNMKQLGLAVRVYASDNSEQFPPDVLSITNELGTPKVLVCPSDSVRHAADSWASYSAANCSYELLSAGPGTWESEPQRVMWRCPIHGSVTLCDGSVQQLRDSNTAARLVSRNGGLYLENNATVSAVAPIQAPPGEIDPELARRYGIPQRRVLSTRTVTTNQQTGEVTDTGPVAVEVAPDGTEPQPQPQQ